MINNENYAPLSIKVMSEQIEINTNSMMSHYLVDWGLYTVVAINLYNGYRLRFYG